MKFTVHLNHFRKYIKFLSKFETVIIHENDWLIIIKLNFDYYSKIENIVRPAFGLTQFDLKTTD